MFMLSWIQMTWTRVRIQVRTARNYEITRRLHKCDLNPIICEIMRVIIMAVHRTFSDCKSSLYQTYTQNRVYTFENCNLLILNPIL